ncbi:hypothetical protein QJQ45_007410 [Haematococcus lacustris]|nr:hypothetical protein QJQ45_007410 [Haematococcus lacustris]
MFLGSKGGPDVGQCWRQGQRRGEEGQGQRRGEEGQRQGQRRREEGQGQGQGRGEEGQAQGQGQGLQGQGELAPALAPLQSASPDSPHSLTQALGQVNPARPTDWATDWATTVVAPCPSDSATLAAEPWRLCGAAGTTWGGPGPWREPDAVGLSSSSSSSSSSGSSSGSSGSSNSSSSCSHWGEQGSGWGRDEGGVLIRRVGQREQQALTALTASRAAEEVAAAAAAAAGAAAGAEGGFSEMSGWWHAPPSQLPWTPLPEPATQPQPAGGRCPAAPPPTCPMRLSSHAGRMQEGQGMPPGGSLSQPWPVAESSSSSSSSWGAPAPGSPPLFQASSQSAGTQVVQEAGNPASQAAMAAGMLVRLQLQQPHPLLGVMSQVLPLGGKYDSGSRGQLGGQGQGVTPAALMSFLVDLGSWCQWVGALAAGSGGGCGGGGGGSGGEQGRAVEAEGARGAGPPHSITPTQSLGSGGRGGAGQAPSLAMLTEWDQGARMGMQARMLATALTVLQYSVRAGMRGVAGLVATQLKLPDLAPTLAAVLASTGLLPLGGEVAAEQGGGGGERRLQGGDLSEPATNMEAAPPHAAEAGAEQPGQQLLQPHQHQHQHHQHQQRHPADQQQQQQQAQQQQQQQAQAVPPKCPRPGPSPASTPPSPRLAPAPWPLPTAALPCPCDTVLLDVDGRTLLHLAVLSGNLDMVLDVLHWAAAAAAAPGSQGEGQAGGQPASLLPPSQAVPQHPTPELAASSQEVGHPSCKGRGYASGVRGSSSSSSSGGGEGRRGHLTPLPCGNWSSQDCFGMTPLHVAALLPDEGRLAASLLAACPDAVTAWRTCPGPMGLSPQQLAPWVLLSPCNASHAVA